MEHQKKTTIYDLAKALNVSVATVYRALHNTGRISKTTKQSILDMAEKMQFKPNQTAQALRRNPIQIGVLLSSSVEQFLQKVKAGVDAAFNELRSLNVYPDIRVIVDTDAKATARKDQIMQALDSFCDGKHDGVILTVSYPSALYDENIRKLVENNIPIATLVADIPVPKRVFHIATNGIAAGGIAASVLRLCCEKKRVAVLIGNMNLPVHRENVEGFKQEAEFSPFSTIDVYEHNDDPKLVLETLKKVFEGPVPYDGVYFATASSAFAASYIMSFPKEKLPKIITTDLFEENRRLLSEGYTVSTIFQDHFRQGRNAVRTLYQHLIGEKCDEIIKVNPSVVFRSNINTFYTPEN